MSPNKAPFAGLVVLELATVLAGPAVGMFFAELGATVVKVEPPSGDVTRTWRLPEEDPQDPFTSYYCSVNWGKRHISLDLQTPDDNRVARQLAQKADVVLTNFKVGSDKKLGLDYESLAVLNPKLIYGQISGYGLENPRAGFDAIVQAEAGFMFLNGEPESLPTKMPVALMDLLAAHQLKEGLLAALYRRLQTGQGACVHISLIQAGVASLANQGASYLATGLSPRRMGSEHPAIAPYGTVFQTKDEKYFLIAVGNDRQFAALCEVMDLPGLASDPMFSTNGERARNRKTLNEILREKIAQKNLAEISQALNEKQIPFGQINEMASVFQIPEAQKMILSEWESGLYGLRTVGFQLDGQFPVQTLRPPQSIGADTDSVLRDFGLL